MTQTEWKGSKQTRRRVLLADKVADKTIKVGGVLVIAAVLGIMVFLVSEVIPLFKDGEATAHERYTLGNFSNPTLGLAIDEFNTIAVRIYGDGRVQAWHARTGTALQSAEFDLKGKQITAFCQALDPHRMAFGFLDGTVRFAQVKYRTEIFPQEQSPKGLKKLDGRDMTDGNSVFSFIPGKQVRRVFVEFILEDDVPVSDGNSPLTAIGYSVGEFGERPIRAVAAVDAEGVPYVIVGESKLNLFTRKVQTTVSRATLPSLGKEARIVRALVTEGGGAAYFAEKGGKIYRFSTRDLTQPFLAETSDVTAPSVELTALGFLLGEGSLVVGAADGSVSIYFLLNQPDGKSPDGLGLVKTRMFEPQPAAVVGFTPSQIGKVFATSDAAGGIWLRHGTSERTLLKLKATGEESATVGAMIQLSPRRDGLLATAETGKTDFWDVQVPHPETSLRSLFGKVWYEGYPEPTYTWQTTGATDAFESKMSLVPLIFGTLKATFYSLLFAIPIALLAAVYTSEFLHPTVRSMVKPVIEVMASIPSVVLGFIGALVLAPVVENWIAAVILMVVVTPLSLIFAAYMWQLVPPRVALRLQGSPKLALMLFVVIGAIYGAIELGESFEAIFFCGDFKAWVNGSCGGSSPFWFLMFLPVSAIAVGLTWARLYGRRFSGLLRRLVPLRAALLDIARWGVLAVITAGLSYLVAVLLQGMGFDPRSTVVGTYVQRNTFVVGFAMGFAVIPIIYTLAEDALSAVPEHLRAASLACGATPWQTALWIILPTAISGVFSAVMIGMGRAVGETMIVVMSAGNTPLIDLNIFNGLRALSANIAVELPEAPKGDTLYLVLFLTGLVLFAMTFVINTLAEMVRLRFRKRSMQL